MYEASYRSYTKASELSPEDVRLLNDRALMALYHVKRDIPAAKEWLEKAIALGEAQLRDAPPADRDARNLLEEAVGDAWQNLGKWFREHGNDVAAARRAYEQSLKYYSPSNRGESRRALQDLQRAGAAGDAGTGAGNDSGKDGK
jgi:tetratricopeptide (TPR) repeat protein